MNFASEYVLKKKNLSSFQNKEKIFEPDTNVISATFDHLIESKNTHAGDAIICSQCSSVLSKYSKISDIKENRRKTWKCEFCNFENTILVQNDEIPNQEEITYLIESNHKVSQNNVALDSAYIIYCIDISGSMSVSTPVQATFSLPTDQRRNDFFRNIDGENHPFQLRPLIRHITRLEAVQVAINDNLTKLEKNDKDKKIGLVTFNHMVSVIGDGNIPQINIESNQLESKNEIKNKVEQTPDLDPLSKCIDRLKQKLLDLEEGGATALGPALYFSVLLASRKSGSKVILCTDGLANKGIGSLETDNEDEITQFYDEVSQLALENGVSVSVITIEGTTCKLGLLGEISSKTGGMVNVVNPINLKEQFSDILEEKIIATNVLVELILPKELYIKDHENFDNRQSKIIKQIGNVTKETEINFEFGVRDDIQMHSFQYPFQLKISYNTLDGTRFLRVLTKLKQITENQDLAEETCNRSILAANAIQTQGKLLQKFSNRANLNQYSDYVTRVRTKKNDLFSSDAYSVYQDDLAKTINSTKTMITDDDSQVLRKLDDQDASKLFNLQKLNARNFSHKKD